MIPPPRKDPAAAGGQTGDFRTGAKMVYGAGVENDGAYGGNLDGLVALVLHRNEQEKKGAIVEAGNGIVDLETAVGPKN